MGDLKGVFRDLEGVYIKTLWAMRVHKESLGFRRDSTGIPRVYNGL